MQSFIVYGGISRLVRSFEVRDITKDSKLVLVRSSTLWQKKLRSFVPVFLLTGLTRQVEITQDNAGQKTVHVKLDAAIFHVLCDDGLD